MITIKNISYDKLKPQWLKIDDGSLLFDFDTLYLEEKMTKESKESYQFYYLHNSNYMAQKILIFFIENLKNIPSKKNLQFKQLILK